MQIKINGNDQILFGHFKSLNNIDKDKKYLIESNDESLSGTHTINFNTLNEIDQSKLKKLYFKESVLDAQVLGAIDINDVKLNNNDYSATISEISSNKFGGIISLNAKSLGLIKKDNITKERKLFGFPLPIGSSIHLRGGVINESLDYTLSIPTYTNTYLDIDWDGAEYERTVLLSNLTEKQSIEMQSMFGQLEYRFGKSKDFKYFLAAGIGRLNISSAIRTESSADAYYSGYYKDLFGITIAENGVYNFGEFSSNNGNPLQENSQKTLDL